MQIIKTLQMMENKLRLPKISFDMPITDLIMKLEMLRYKIIESDTHPLVFLQIKQIFQTVESIGSSRIEGNNTTILDYVESTRIQQEPNFAHENIKEIMNIENAMKFVEDNVQDFPITTKFIRELHQLTVAGLSYRKEGALHPGTFREQNVRIGGSTHTPPDYTQVIPMMQELIEFVNKKDAPKYDLLKIAIAHHRFVWIHPFENGNGRVVRLFTYAMLLKLVFKSKDRIINPTAVFCSNRSEYYKHLSYADDGTDDGLIKWSEYMLQGLLKEIEKIDNLASYSFLKNTILEPALANAKESAYIQEDEYKILKATIQKADQEIQSSDLSILFHNLSSSDRSRKLRKLIDKGMLKPKYEGARKYVIAFSNNYLLRSILKELNRNGFLPINN